MTIDDTTIRSKRESTAHKTCPAINLFPSEWAKFKIKSCNLLCLEIKVVENMSLQNFGRSMCIEGVVLQLQHTPPLVIKPLLIPKDKPKFPLFPPFFLSPYSKFD